MGSEARHEAPAVDLIRARRLLKEPGIVWHQRFPIAEGVLAPGVSDIEWLADISGLPADLTGLSVLDVGTTNGGASFLAESRGASSVTATDILPPAFYGFAQLAELFGSNARFVQSSIYELPEALGGETFDVVIFWGVLYHLRHPLLGLDCVRRLTHGEVYIESAVCDYDMPSMSDRPAVRCDIDPAGIGDETNWFAPNVCAMRAWVEKAGFEIEEVRSWPNPAGRAHIRARASQHPPRYLVLGNAFERPMRAQPVDPASAYPRRRPTR
jgi:tRNA (mo5U34)-methyltransferase